MKVLQIDDSPQICEMFADMFDGEHNSIKSVNDGRTGLDLTIKNDFDLILLDIRMPHYSGMDFLQDLKKQRPSELKKVVVTSLLQFDEIQMNELMNFGIHSVEKKPTNFQQIEALQKTISQKPIGKKPQSMKILIIDDHPENASMLSNFFNSKGFQTKIAKEPWDGFKYIEDEQFDAILLEMDRQEFNGMQIIKMLATKEILKDQNIFILPSRFGHNNKIKELLERDGINGILKNPIEPEEILKTITRGIYFQKRITLENP